MRKTMLILLALTMLIWPAAATAQNSSPVFADGDHWASRDIQAVAGLGLMNGIGSNDAGQGLFLPQGTVSRAQLATILTNTFGLDYSSKRFIKEPLASDYYRDLDNQAWYAPAVVMCAINDIFPTGGDFRPDQPATRLEIAQAVSRSFNAKGISVPMILMMPVFNDTDGLSQEEMNAVVFVNNTGVMRGSDDYFRPGDNLTRAEMAVVVMRCVELMAAREHDGDSQLQVPTGGIFYLSLASNPTTGYEWMVASGGGDQIIKKTGSSYRPHDALDLALAGQGGRQYWRFQAVQEGSTDLQLQYVRPWESVQPQQKYNLKVIVSPALTSTPSLSTTNVGSAGQYMTVDAQIPVLHGLAGQTFQARINAIWEQDLQELKTGLTAQLDDYIRYNQDNNFPIHSWQLFSRYQLGALNQNLLSLYVDYYTYTGGAHGLTDRRPYNFDLQQGERLELADLFQAGYDYRGVINQEIAARIAADPSIYFSGDMGFKSIRDDQGFYLKGSQLVVYFSQYEIAPYATGIPEFAIPLARFGDGLQARFSTS